MHFAQDQPTPEPVLQSILQGPEMDESLGSTPGLSSPPTSVALIQLCGSAATTPVSVAPIQQAIPASAFDPKYQQGFQREVLGHGQRRASSGFSLDDVASDFRDHLHPQNIVVNENMVQEESWLVSDVEASPNTPTTASASSESRMVELDKLKLKMELEEEEKKKKDQEEFLLQQRKKEEEEALLERKKADEIQKKKEEQEEKERAEAAAEAAAAAAAAASAAAAAAAKEELDGVERKRKEELAKKIATQQQKQKEDQAKRAAASATAENKKLAVEKKLTEVEKAKQLQDLEAKKKQQAAIELAQQKEREFAARQERLRIEEEQQRQLKVAEEQRRRQEEERLRMEVELRDAAEKERKAKEAAVSATAAAAAAKLFEEPKPVVARWVPKPEAPIEFSRPTPIAAKPVFVRPTAPPAAVAPVVAAPPSIPTIVRTRVSIVNATMECFSETVHVQAPPKPAAAPRPPAAKIDSKARLKVVYGVFVKTPGTLSLDQVVNELGAAEWTLQETEKTLNMLVVLKLLQKIDNKWGIK